MFVFVFQNNRICELILLLWENINMILRMKTESKKKKKKILNHSYWRTLLAIRDYFHCCSFEININNNNRWNMKNTDRLRLTHWGRVTHICASKLTIIGSDNGLSPGRRQAIIWTNAGILLIRTLGTNFSESSIGIQTFSVKKMHLKMPSAK